MISKIRCEAICNTIHDTIQDFIMEREVPPELEKELFLLRDDIWNNVAAILPRHKDEKCSNSL
jgi:hypothetical protein